MARFKKVYGGDVSVGTETYRADLDGGVDVPIEAVGALLERGGFTVDIETVPMPEGSALMRHADLSAAFSWGGISGSAGDDGLFVVPAAAVGDLMAHGFVIVDEAELETPVVTAPKLKIPNK